MFTQLQKWVNKLQQATAFIPTRLYTSKTNALDGSVESIESMGALQDTQTDVDQLTATSLDPDTRYYFNVVVENLEGEKTAYVAGSIN